MIPEPSVQTLKAAITGNVSNQEMVDDRTGRDFGGSAIEAGGRIVINTGAAGGTATTADITVVDSTGKVLHATATRTTSLTVDPIPMGIRGPLYVTVANISNAAHTLTVYWSVKK